MIAALRRLRTRRSRVSGSHAALIVEVGPFDRALACACGAVFPVRRGDDPGECPEWHAHITVLAVTR